MEQILLNLGAGAIGFYFLKYFMDRTFAENDKKYSLDREYDTALRKTEKESMDKLIDAVHDVMSKDIQLITVLHESLNSMKEQYSRILLMFDKQIELTSEIHFRTKLCVKLQEKEIPESTD